MRIIYLKAAGSDVHEKVVVAAITVLGPGRTDAVWPVEGQLVKALAGQVKAHHRFVLTELLCQIDSSDETIVRFDEQIEAACCPFEEAVQWLDTIPGASRRAAEVVVSEIGTDMSRFETADHLASWAGVAHGNHESAGKRRSGKTRHGNKPLGVTLSNELGVAKPV